MDVGGLAPADQSPGSIFDAMIVTAAFHAGCDTLLSEGMQHGMALDEGRRIATPFLPKG